jgi:hypothetical protein
MTLPAIIAPPSRDTIPAAKYDPETDSALEQEGPMADSSEPRRQLSRAIPPISRIPETIDDPGWRDLAVSLGTFVVWLHHEWPTMVDQFDEFQEKLDLVHEDLMSILRVMEKRQ